MACGGNNVPIDGNPKPGVEVKWEIAPTATTFSSTGETKSIKVSKGKEFLSN